MRTYILAPRHKRVEGTAPTAVVKANRQRVESDRGQALLRRRCALLERPFAHQIRDRGDAKGQCAKPG